MLMLSYVILCYVDRTQPVLSPTLIPLK